MLFCAVSRRVSRASIRLHDGRRPRTLRRPETRQTVGQADKLGALLVWPAYRREVTSPSCPLRGSRVPCPQARESRSPRIGLSWPAEEGHLSPPLLSWQLCLFPQGWVYPAGAAARCLGDPYCVPYRNGEWGAWLYRLVVPPAGGLMIPHCQDSQRSYRQKDQMTKTPADPAYHHLSLSMYLQVLYRCCARHLRRITGQ